MDPVVEWFQDDSSALQLLYILLLFHCPISWNNDTAYRNGATDPTWGGGAQAEMQAIGSGCNYRWRFACCHSAPAVKPDSWQPMGWHLSMARALGTPAPEDEVQVSHGGTLGRSLPFQGFSSSLLLFRHSDLGCLCQLGAVLHMCCESCRLCLLWTVTLTVSRLLLMGLSEFKSPCPHPARGSLAWATVRILEVSLSWEHSWEYFGSSSSQFQWKLSFNSLIHWSRESRALTQGIQAKLWSWAQ